VKKWNSGRQQGLKKNTPEKRSKSILGVRRIVAQGEKPKRADWLKSLWKQGTKLGHV